ncbi:hypothetical protein EV175_002054 [Coemansia sp. RSA 1933]|nr:hypothetical protein EV175_002054 [Coemansia sp. RSA 1933]
MPELPDEKPTLSRRGRGEGAPRGRGRAKPAQPTTTPETSAAGAPPTHRLSSLRGTPGSSPSTSSGNSSATGSKMRFKPNIPTRRNKKDVSELLSNSPPAEAKQENRDTKIGRGRGRESGRGRGRFEMIQMVSGPFAQGPASLGGSYGARNRRSGAGGAFNMGILPPGVSSAGGKKPAISSASLNVPGTATPAMEVDDGTGFNDPDAPVCIFADHNENIQTDEFEVQTEEMAIRAMEEMKHLKLDYTVADAIGSAERIKKENEKDEEADRGEFKVHDKMLVFQLPAIPEFELGEKAQQKQLADKQRRSEMRKSMVAAAAASAAALAATNAGAIQEDVKPNIVDLDNADSAADSVDVKPDIAALEEQERNANTESKAEADDNTDIHLDGRIGTLVVLKSGAVKLKIGDILLDVSKGANTQFLRGLLAVDMRGPNSAFMLGNIDEQLVCTPDLDSIL